MSDTVFAATVPERSTIEERFKWDLTKRYAAPAEWDAHYQRIDGMIADFASRAGKVTASPETLLAALKLRDQINIQLEKRYGYAAMRKDEDMRVPATQALAQRVQTLAVKWDEAGSWFAPELLKMPEDWLRDWIKQPDLKVYAHYFDDLLRAKAHILSVEPKAGRKLMRLHKTLRRSQQM